MNEERFLSPAGKRFIAIAALLIIGGLIAYYASSEEISFDFIEEIGQTTTSTSTTFPEVEIPEVTVPEVEVPEAQIPDTPSGSAADKQIREAEKILECISKAEGDVDVISACTQP